MKYLSRQQFLSSTYFPVVSLRQLERQMLRERERSAEMLKTQEEHLQLEMCRVKSQLKEAERDRNLLMVGSQSK